MGLEGVTSIESIVISGNNLTSLAGLEGMSSIEGQLLIQANPALTSLAGLDNLNYIRGELSILWNESLTSLAGLNIINSDSIDHLRICDNYSLSSCEVQSICNYLANPGGVVTIYNNAPGCNNPSEVASLCGFILPCLPFGNYYILSQSDVDNFASNYIGCTELEGDLHIEGNDIVSLSGLSQVTSIGETLIIGYNHALTNLTGLNNLSSIGETLIIGYNHALTNLTGLNNLSSIGENLEITHNYGLISLEGLKGTIEGSCKIYDNYSLSYCHTESICAYLANPNGIININGNAIGCNSPEEVQDSCEANSVLIEEQYIIESNSVSPNPFTNSTTLSYTLSKPATVTITIFNPHGQLIEKIEQEQPIGEQQVIWNAEGLPAGMYYYRIQAGEKIGNGKMVKMG
jgi:hypothetical protein